MEYKYIHIDEGDICIFITPDIPTFTPQGEAWAGLPTAPM